MVRFVLLSYLSGASGIQTGNWFLSSHALYQSCIIFLSLKRIILFYAKLFSQLLLRQCVLQMQKSVASEYYTCSDHNFCVLVFTAWPFWWRISQHAAKERPSKSSPLPAASNYFRSVWSDFCLCVKCSAEVEYRFCWLPPWVPQNYICVTGSINGSEEQDLSETYHGSRLWGYLASFGWSILIKPPPCLKRLEKNLFTFFALKYSCVIFTIPMSHYRAKEFFLHRIFFIFWSMLQQHCSLLMQRDEIFFSYAI